MRNRLWKRWICRFSMIVLCFFGCVGLVNYVTFYIGFEETMANMQIARMTVFYNLPNNFDERLFQRKYIEKLQEAPDTVIIGSSRGMLLDRMIVNSEKTYNNCISGATLADLYAILGIYHERKFVIQKVIIEVSPWIFYENKESRWRDHLGEFYLKYKKLITKGKDDPTTEIQTGDYQALRLLSVQLFARKVRYLLGDGKEIASFKKGANFYAKYPDGSILYSDNFAQRSDEEILQDIKSKPVFNGMVGFEEMDTNKTEEFRELVAWLAKNKTEVVFFLSPFPPSIYEYFMQSSYKVVQEVESYLKRLATEYQIELRGTYNPNLVGLADTDFYDSFHAKKEAHRILWEFRWSRSATMSCAQSD